MEFQTDMEMELLGCESMAEKCKASEDYSQNLYAALCNNHFVRDDAKWACSWRQAGSVVANLLGEGDYLDWYCSGTSDFGNFVPEGVVTEEIRNDLALLGWSVL